MVKGVLLTIAFVTSISFSSIVENNYKMGAEVINISEEKITVLDEAGEIWDFYGDELEVNELITLEFDSNHTNTRIDDIIINYEPFN